MNLEGRIMQAQMVLSLKKQLFKAKRCTLEELERAEDVLTALEQESQGFENEVAQSTNEKPAVTSAKNYDEYQKELTLEARKLSDEQANISNQIVAAYRAKAGSAGGLMKQAIALRNKIENIWDKKKFLERNGSLPPESSFEAEQEQLESEESRLKRMALQQQRKLIKDQIGKLEKKIADPTKHVRFNKAEEKVNEWRKQLLICQEELSRVCLEVQV